MKMQSCVIFVVLFGHACSQPLFSEDIFKANTSGTQIVETVVDVITSTCLLDNDIFLRRMGHVETNDGVDTNTYTGPYHGGIWKIDKAMFEATQNRSELVVAYDVIKHKLHIDWSNVTWSDMRRPIYSALAATLLLTVKHFQTVPENLEIQATIWNALHPDRSTAFMFVREEYTNTIDCHTDKMLDIVIILHFRSLTPYQLNDLRTFLESLLQRFDLNLNSTRVGIVTKRQMRPVADWYLDSQSTGVSVLNTLKALNYQTGGPTGVGEALMLTRDEMFNVTKGARPQASKIALLITDEITPVDNVHNEAKKLRNTGVRLMVLHITNKTQTQLLRGLVDKPTCKNSRSLKSFDDLGGVVERLTRTICSAPADLAVGTITFPCSHSMNVRLPDSSNGLSLMVTPSSGNITIFGAKMYEHPDKDSHDVRMVSLASNSTVLYVRGTDPMYVHVKGQGPSCTGTYTVETKETDTFPRKEGVCVVAGTVRECNDLDMELATHDLVLVPDTDAPFLCNTRNRSLEYFPHPTDVKKFIMCDRDDNTFIGLCPVGGAKCEAFTSGCKYTNPCTADALVGGAKYFMEPCGDQETYVTCTVFGVAQITQCLPSYVWNQDTMHCVFKYVHDAVSNTFYTHIDNPCIHAHSEHVYFPFPKKPDSYIFCDTFGNAIATSCKGGAWNEQLRACTLDSVTPIG